MPQRFDGPLSVSDHSLLLAEEGRLQNVWVNACHGHGDRDHRSSPMRGVFRICRNPDSGLTHLRYVDDDDTTSSNPKKKKKKKRPASSLATRRSSRKRRITPRYANAVTTVAKKPKMVDMSTQTTTSSPLPPLSIIEAALSSPCKITWPSDHMLQGEKWPTPLDVHDQDTIDYGDDDDESSRTSVDTSDVDIDTDANVVCEFMRTKRQMFSIYDDGDMFAASLMLDMTC